MNTVSNYQPRPLSLGRNNFQRCEICEKERDDLQQTFCMAYSTVVCMTGCCILGYVTPLPKCCLGSAALTGSCALRCWNIAGSTVDKCLKDRECCHLDNLPYQSDSGESDYFGASEIDDRKELLVDVYPPTQFRVINPQPGTNSVRKRAVPGGLTSPHHSFRQDNANRDVPANAVRKTKANFVLPDMIKELHSSFGTQNRNDK